MSEKTFASKVVKIWRLRQRIVALKKARKELSAARAELRAACSALSR